LIETLVVRATARGRSVAAIKHTHHTPEPTRRGDTERLIAAGATPVILCDDRIAIRFTRGEAAMLSDPRPETLLQSIEAELVFIEGFQHRGDWTRLLIVDGSAQPESWNDLPHLVAVVSDAVNASDILPALPHFGRGDVATLEAFVDRISGP
jgi:molybdopterin-guanine dinucleotide biosynthesis protein MobB